MFSLFICSVFMLLFIYIPKSTNDIYRSVFSFNSFNSFKYKLFIIFQKSVIVKFTKNYLSFNFPCCFPVLHMAYMSFFSFTNSVLEIHIVKDNKEETFDVILVCVIMHRVISNNAYTAVPKSN